MSKITTFLRLYISTRLSPITASKHTAALSDEMGMLCEKGNDLRATDQLRMERRLQQLKVTEIEIPYIVTISPTEGAAKRSA